MAETAESGGGCGTATVTESGTAEPENRSLTLKLRKRKPDKKVEWSSDTVDNEHLGRRSSKCERPDMTQNHPKNGPKTALKYL
ncbi:E3 ubiquitin-protein ligase PPP1R11 isoform X2 [Ammospiza caudacuta]|uniref:E3 ubiquitin-protein ligase PPP1R11 isoform X2 n=1 Tax=Ammospiza caudacuta TaxID=2857398 RepID=UPI002739D4B8|nr:E3 ubiquitin-protein ligase PPP1R11 isoform X2 [Ammospiza caudacuta]